jgi:hypothetical protein
VLRQTAGTDPVRGEERVTGSETPVKRVLRETITPGAVMRWGVIALVALGGWGWAAWEHFVLSPAQQDVALVTYSLALVDRFDDTEAHRTYVQLASDMKPWWDSIDGLQRRIQTAATDEVREALIAERDASLVAFIKERGLGSKIDLLIHAFDEFLRCLDTRVCDQEVLDRAIGIDVKRIYRTFRPYILMRRNGGGADAEFGKDLEELFFRLIG